MAVLDIFLIVAMFTPFAVSQWELYVRGHLNVGDSWEDNLGRTGWTRGIVIKYNVSFSVSKCCPSLYVYNSENDVTRAKCYPDCSLIGDKHLNPALIYMYPGENMNCSTGQTDITCHGIRTIRTPTAFRWTLAATYACSSPRPLDIHYNVRIDELLDTTCEEVQFEQCRVHYTKAIFPNFLGNYDQNVIVRMTSMANFIQSTSCYKYAAIFICLFMYPRCKDGQMYTPCKKTCLEVKDACDEIFKLNRVVLSCNWYPDTLDPEVCFYKPVYCDDPDSTEHGHVIYISTEGKSKAYYDCEEGFEIQGPDEITCLMTGKWSHDPPACVPKQDDPLSLLFTIMCGLLLLIAVGQMVWGAVTVTLFNTVGFRFTLKDVASSKQFDAFVSACSADDGIVQSLLIPTLERENYIIYNPYRDYISGAPIVYNIVDTIPNCRRVVMFVTHNYLHSDVCMHDYNIALQQVGLIEDHDFRIIVIVDDGVTVADLPPVHGIYSNFVTYIKWQRGGAWFWSQIKYAMPDPLNDFHSRG